MKYKKYLLILLIALFIGCNSTYAETKRDTNQTILNEITDSETIKIAAKTTSTEYNRNNIDCDGIFGSKNDPDSLRYLLNEILQYPRIIIPILVIGLGTLDMAKAVIASKPDEMTKAQKTFVRRCIIGVVAFFIPTIMNILMYLADLVWNGMYTTCGL